MKVNSLTKLSASLLALGTLAASVLSASVAFTTNVAEAATTADILNNPRITFSSNARGDLHMGIIDQRVIDVIDQISKGHTLRVGTLKAGHTSGGTKSHHHYGRGLDIETVDGEIVRPTSNATRALVNEIKNYTGSIKPDELGQPFLGAGDCTGGTYCFTKGHADHIHLGYAAAVRPSVPPPTTPNRTFVGGNVTADGQGYAHYGITDPTKAEGFHFGTVASQLNWGNLPAPLVDFAVTADGNGIAGVTASCHTYASGTAKAWLNPPVVSGDRCVAIALSDDGQKRHIITAAGRGYSDGGPAFANPVGFSGEIVAMDLTGDATGRVVLSSAGQAYHDGTMKPFLNPPAVAGAVFSGVATTASGDGRIMVDRRGHVYADGTAKAVSANPVNFTGDIIDIDITSDGAGAIATSSIGQGYHWGTVVSRGNGDPGTAGVPSSPPSQPVTSGRVLPASLQLSPYGVEFLKQYEGFRATTYNDQAGHCTIGYGHLIHHGGCTSTDQNAWGSISQARASEMLTSDANSFADVIRRGAPGTALSQNEFDALVSLAFNIGAGNFNSSSVLKDLKASPPNYAAVPGHIALWNKVKVNGRLVISCGLRNRRAAESRLFTTGQYTGSAPICSASTASANEIAALAADPDDALSTTVPQPSEGGLVSPVVQFPSPNQVMPASTVTLKVDASGWTAMTWQVDGGQANPMTTAADGTFVADINTGGWAWSSSGTYTLSFCSQPGTCTNVPIVVPQLQVKQPTDGASLRGLTTFQVTLPGVPTSGYTATWAVDSGQPVSMTANSDGTFTAPVDVSGWTWRGEGPYQLRFTATTGSSVYTRDVTVKVTQ